MSWSLILVRPVNFFLTTPLALPRGPSYSTASPMRKVFGMSLLSLGGPLGEPVADSAGSSASDPVDSQHRVYPGCRWKRRCIDDEEIPHLVRLVIGVDCRG